MKKKKELTGEELGALAEQMIAATDPKKAEAFRTKIIEGFYGGDTPTHIPVAKPGGPKNSYSSDVGATGYKIDWPRIRRLPPEEQAPFRAWLGNAKRPLFEGVPDDEQDGYFPWDWEEWFYGEPGIWI